MEPSHEESEQSEEFRSMPRKRIEAGMVAELENGYLTDLL